MLVGEVVLRWNLEGRQTALREMAAKMSPNLQLHSRSHDERATKIQQTICELGTKIQNKEEEIVNRARKGWLDRTTKNAINQMIKEYKALRETKMIELDKAAKAWEKKLHNLRTKGSPQKRGRKRVSAVTFKSARDLKRVKTSIASTDSPSDDDSLMSTKLPSDDDNQGNSDDPEWYGYHDTEYESSTASPTQSSLANNSQERQNSGDISSTKSSPLAASSLTEVDTSCEPTGIGADMETVPCKLGCPEKPKSAGTYEDRLCSIFMTTTQIAIASMKYCQFRPTPQSSSTPIRGCSACTGISALACQKFLQGEAFNNHISASGSDEMYTTVASWCAEYTDIITQGKLLWDANELGCLDVRSTLLMDDFKGIKIASEELWQPSVIGGNPVEVLKSVIDRCQDKKRVAVIITFEPSQSCSLLVTENQDLIFLDSHVHYTANEEEQSFHDALNRGLGACIMFAGAKNTDTFLKHIVNVAQTEMRCNPIKGEASVLCLATGGTSDSSKDTSDSSGDTSDSSN